jgi:hypothetical protein
MTAARGTLRIAVTWMSFALAALCGLDARSAPPAGKNCSPAAPAKQSKCSADYQCCAGLVCQSYLGDGMKCQPGCRIAGAFFAAGAPNPANPCQSCQPAVSTTAWSGLANGTACNDGNACTRSDVCTGGVCAGTPYTCAAPGACQQPGTCNGDGTCSFANKANGSTCDDGDLCTQMDSCQAGVCTGTPVVCRALDACHVAGTCQPTSGSCTNPTAPNGTACSDNNPCSTSDSCQNGTCAGVAVVCPAGEVCRQGACQQLAALTPNPEAFSYTEGAAAASALDLGNVINNDTDPNAGGAIGFSTFSSASFQTPSSAFLQAFVGGLTVAVNTTTVTIADLGNHAATITINASGEESISDPYDIFSPLNAGEAIVLNVNYAIDDTFGLTAPDSQTVTIHGVNAALISSPEAFDYVEGAAVASALDLGNAVANDIDPNHDGIVRFSSFSSAAFETPPSAALQAFVAGLSVAVVNATTVTITDLNNHAATITANGNGEEFLSDPFNMFSPLNAGDAIVLDVRYTIDDTLGLSAPDSQTLTILGN